MFFIYPMWDSEIERIGKQNCTPIGYKIHMIADLIGFIGLMLFLCVACAVLMCIVIGGGTTSPYFVPLLWLFVVPFCFGIIGSIVFRYSWYLAEKQGFHYDYASREASWIEGGERRTYKYEDLS